MSFIEVRLDNILFYLEQLDENTKPLWGEMSAQRMIEHLSDTFDLALGKLDVTLEIPQDKVIKAQAFLKSEYPMPQNFKASFASTETPVRHDNLKESIDEFVTKWNEYEAYYRQNPTKKNLHPNFGDLNKDQWHRIQAKHLTHHFVQFGLIE